MAKTKQQLLKQKKAVEKRKKIEKAVLKLGADMDAQEKEQAASSSATEPIAAPKKA